MQLTRVLFTLRWGKGLLGSQPQCLTVHGGAEQSPNKILDGFWPVGASVCLLSRHESHPLLRSGNHSPGQQDRPNFHHVQQAILTAASQML